MRQAIALVVLMLLAGLAVRGVLPGAVPREPRVDAASDPMDTAVVIGLLAAAVGVVVLAVVVRLRQRSAVAAAAGRPDWLRGDSGRFTWRTALIVCAAVLAWVGLTVLLARLDPGEPPEPQPAEVTSGQDRARTPAPSATPQPAAPAQPPGSEAGDDLIPYFYAATVVFLGVLIVGAIAGRARRRDDEPGAADGFASADTAVGSDGSESLARAAEVGLSAVEDLSRDPRTAIIACYAAMERELARVPDAAPQEFDTASEVLARAVAHHALEPGAATQLVELFDEARFSPHLMNEGHRELAVRALQQVLAELPEVAP